MKIVLEIDNKELEFHLYERITSCFNEEISTKKFNNVFKEHKDKIIQGLNFRLNNELDIMELFGEILDDYLLNNNIVRNN